MQIFHQESQLRAYLQELLSQRMEGKIDTYQMVQLPFFLGSLYQDHYSKGCFQNSRVRPSAPGEVLHKGAGWLLFRPGPPSSHTLSIRQYHLQRTDTTRQVPLRVNSP